MTVHRRRRPDPIVGTAAWPDYGLKRGLRERVRERIADAVLVPFFVLLLLILAGTGLSYVVWSLIKEW